MKGTAITERRGMVLPGALLWAALACLGASFFLLWNQLTYSPDSWALYELSQTIFGGNFYEVRHIRSFEQAGAFSSAFPPLWPTLLALTDALTGLGARAGFVLAVISSLLFACASEQYGRRALGVRWVGLTAAMLVFVMPGFRDEVLAGRTIPLQLALYATVLAITARGLLRLREGLLVGLTIGLAVMNRFDALPVALLLPFLALLLRPKATFFAGYIATFLLTISPWMIYSRARFGTWFKSDNSSIALGIEPRHIAEWYPAPSATAFDAPLAWFGKVASNGLAMSGHFVISLGVVTCLGLLVVVLSIVRQQPGTDIRESAPLPPLRLLVFGPLLMSLTLSGYVVTGYFDDRYFVALWWSLMVVGLAMLVRRRPPTHRGAGAVSAALLAMVFAFVIAVAVPARTLPRQPSFPKREGDAALLQCLAGHRGKLLMLSDHVEASRLTAVYGLKTIMMPRNIEQLQREDIAAFLKRYQVGIVAVEAGREPPFQLTSKRFVRMPGCPSGWFQQMVNQSVVHQPNETVHDRDEPR
ncbi:hypothetical protein [Sphingomonas sp. LHG3443-2]|uniref:hypothetical protein n=1 Tax=Sphingomonas sp. LHG3443-2 TaxID=2804639 RepID=UPI003CF70596